MPTETVAGSVKPTKTLGDWTREVAARQSPPPTPTIADTQTAQYPHRFREILSLREVWDLPEPEHRWIVDGMFAAGTLSMLYSDPKAGKSTFIRNLLLRVSRGEPFLGRETSGGPVFYVCLEDKPIPSKYVWKDLTSDPDCPIYFAFHRVEQGTLGACLQHAIDTYNPVLVVIDVLVKAIIFQDLNSYAEVAYHLSDLDEICRLYPQVHLMVAHHTHRAHGKPTDRIMGSQGVYGGVDAAFYLGVDKHENRWLEAEDQRYGLTIPRIDLHFDRKSGAIDVLDWEMSDEAKLQFAIRAALSQSSAPQSQSAITDAVPRRRQAVLAMLETMTKDGSVIRSGSGNKGDQFRYQLPPTPASHKAAVGGSDTHTGMDANPPTDSVPSIHS